MSSHVPAEVLTVRISKTELDKNIINDSHLTYHISAFFRLSVKKIIKKLTFLAPNFFPLNIHLYNLTETGRT